MNQDSSFEQPQDSRRWTVWLGCALVVTLLGLILLLLSPLRTSLFPSSPSAAGPAPAAAVLPPRASQPSVEPHPTVELAVAAAPASAEQLEQEARSAASELRSAYPQLPEALHVAAVLHAQMRETEEAEKLWQRCLELEPASERYAVNLAAIAMDRGDSELAAATLGKLVEQGSGSPDVLHHYGLALTNLGQAAKAETLLRRAVELYPQSASHWLVLGQAQLKQGEAADAEQSLQKALALGAQSAEVYFHLANASKRQGKEEQAAEFQAKFTELKESTPLDAQQRFQVLSAAEARSTAYTILIESASVHAMQADPLRAELLLLRAVALDPRSPAAYRELASLYEKSQLLPEEQAVRRRLTEIEPFSFENHLLLAQVSAALGQAERAEASLKLALSLQPAAAVGYVALAEFYDEVGSADKALWFAREAVRRHPSAEGHQLVAKLARRAGDEATAERAAEAAKQSKAGR